MSVKNSPLKVSELNFSLDSAKVDVLIEEIKTLEPEKSEAVQLFLSRPNAAQELFRFKSLLDPALGTNELIVSLEPTDRFLDFVEALRAKDFN